MAGLDALALRVLAPGFAGTSLPTDYAQLLREGLGGICLFGSNVGPGLRTLTDSIRAAAAQVPVIAVDEEGGDVTRLEASSGSSVLGAAALGAAGDLALTTATGARVGAMLAAAGIGLDLAPVADVNSNPANPVIGTRSFASSPETVAEQVNAWCRGLRSAGVAACVKHFPGHGDTDQDSHLTLPVLDVPVETLRSRELMPFVAAFGEGAAAVMTAHVLVPSLDPDLPASLSPAAYRLLDELGYDGLRVTDALDMAGVSAGRGIPAAAVLALKAGADLLLLGPETPVTVVRATQEAILAAVSAGELSIDRLEEAVARIELMTSGDALSPDGRVETSPGRALVGARAALRADGALPTLPDLTGAHVVSVSTSANIAVGEVPWGLPSDVVVRPGDPLPALPDAPLIVQVRDLHRRPEIGTLVASLERAAILVEWGWPATYDGTLPRLCPRGSSLPGVAAVTEVLCAAGWR